MPNKFYEDTELRLFLNKWVGKMEVKNVYKPLLVDILMRRAFEFELSPEDISQDMQSLMDNLKCIEIKTLPKKFNTMGGVYNSATKTITLNARILDQLTQRRYDPKFYEILTHEVYHALSRDEKGNDRLSNINSYTGRYNHSLLEVIVEKAADRCVYPRRGEAAPYFNQNAYGYSDITFMTDALAATYGVTEKEFLKNAIMGRNRLINFLASRGNEPRKETAKFLDTIEANFEQLHAALYPIKILSRKESPEEFEAKIRTIKSSMANIYNWCESKFAGRIENTPLGGIREAERFENEVKFNHNRLTFVMEDALYRFSGKYNRPDILNDVSRAVDDTRSEATDRINDIDTVIKNYYKLSLSDAVTLINESRYGKLKNYAPYIGRLGITLQDAKFFREHTSTLNEYYHHDFQPTTWENDTISDYMARRLPHYVKKGSSIVNAISIILPFKIRKDMLPEGREPEEEIQLQKTEFGALPKEERDRINSVKVKPKQKEEREVGREKLLGEKE